MHRILITGATGFLGGAVARALHGQGREALATGRDVRRGAALEESGITFEPCDLSAEAATVERLVNGCDAVVHAAALSAPWGRRTDFLGANVTATKHVVQACERAGIKRLVHVSSPSVLFKFQEQRALTENTVWSGPPANDYIATKRAAETIVLGAAGRGLDAIILRPKALFGPGDTTLLPRMIRVVRRGRFPLLGEGDPLMDLTWIGDAVQAVIAALQAPPACRGRVYHVTSGDPQPRGTVLHTLLEACGLPVRFRRVSLGKALAMAGLLEMLSRVVTLGRWEPPLTRYSVGALAYSQTLDISAAREDLHYAPQTEVLAALRDCGAKWQAAQASIDQRSR
jgi:nucleoside-diphosphate-sugar epimerase